MHKASRRKRLQFNSEYLNFPIDIVPQLTLETFKTSKLDKIDYWERPKKQQKWAKLQIIESSNVPMKSK